MTVGFSSVMLIPGYAAAAHHPTPGTRGSGGPPGGAKMRAVTPEQRPIGIHRGGPPETVLEPPAEEARAALEEARSLSPEERPHAVREVVRRWPRFLDAWAELGELASGVEAYAYFRVGYHRGLDTLRASGWRGTGYVRWEHETNRGFLRSLEGLGRLAGEIGETDEEQRCAEFLAQLDPDHYIHQSEG